MSKEKSSIGFGLGLLAGVVGGIVAGILYAPCPGSEMRAKVKDTVCDLAEKYSPEVEEAKKQAMESVDLLKYKLDVDSGSKYNKRLPVVSYILIVVLAFVSNS